MARIQVLRLPTEAVGRFESTPFVLVIDGIDGGVLLSEFPLDVA